MAKKKSPASKVKAAPTAAKKDARKTPAKPAKKVAKKAVSKTAVKKSARIGQASPAPAPAIQALPKRKPAQKRQPVKLAAGYRPSASEPYMSPMQLEFFRQKLLDWQRDLLEESQNTIDEMRNAARDVSDEAERASREAEISFELRTRDRYRKLLSKIDQALNRIEDGSYGYCEETGEPIGLERLEARPVATLSIEAQQRRERLERQYSDHF